MEFAGNAVGVGEIEGNASSYPCNCLASPKRKVMMHMPQHPVNTSNIPIQSKGNEERRIQRLCLSAMLDTRGARLMARNRTPKMGAMHARSQSELPWLSDTNFDSDADNISSTACFAASNRWGLCAASNVIGSGGNGRTGYIGCRGAMCVFSRMPSVMSAGRLSSRGALGVKNVFLQRARDRAS